MTTAQIRAATIAVFVVATMLRLVLATVNREQSDNHVTLINSIASENRIPDYDRETESPKEGFQPKLYHATVAAILRLDPSPVESAPCVSEYPGSPHVVWVGQTVSAVAGILTIWVVLRFLALVGLSERARLFTFALIALNPALIGINVQVTNDSFMILFGSLSSYWGYRFFRDFRVLDFCCMTAAVIATAMSKATGLPIVFAVVLVFAIAVVRRPEHERPGRTKAFSYAALLLVAVLVSFTIVAPKVGAFWEHYRAYGTPFVTNRIPEPFPRLFTPTFFTGDPGVRSIAESLFTFRIFGLLRDPMVSHGRTDHYPLHRTSLWSQVYGRLISMRFDEYFETWRSPSSLVTGLVRLNLLVALVPAALILFGMVGAMTQAFSEARNVRLHEWLIVITAAGYTMFLVVLALRYRDYSFFKPIHAFGGLLAFSAIFGRAVDRLHTAREGHPAVRAADLLLGALILLYTLDATLLAVQLFHSCRTA